MKNKLFLGLLLCFTAACSSSNNLVSTSSQVCSQTQNDYIALKGTQYIVLYPGSNKQQSVYNYDYTEPLGYSKQIYYRINLDNHCILIKEELRNGNEELYAINYYQPVESFRIVEVFQ